MIITSEYKEATVSANVETFSGSFALNAETFKIMISGIYKDKSLAAVREPLFNAIDSHIEAKKLDIPIKIHTPTNLEQWFSVQDFGVGMSKETVTKLFMSLGTSTKRNSNELVGAKGIGSKAPFAITDTFTVTSVHDGVKSSYSVYKDRGIPKISVLSSMPSDDCNGVEVKFSVEPSQVEPMRDAIHKCLAFVKSPYEINDPYVAQLLEETKPKAFYTREIDGWRAEFYSNRKGKENVVIMGQQPYISETLKDYASCAVFVPIGTCDVSPGREHTEEGEEDGGFSEKLKAFMEKVSKEVGDSIVAELEKTKDISEAFTYFNTVPSSYFVTRFGYGWLRDKVYGLTGSSEALSTLAYEKSRWRKSFCAINRDQKLTPLELLRIPAVLYADKKTALKRSAEYLMKTHSMDVCYIIGVDDPGAKLAEDDYFKPLFIYATSFNAPKLPRDVSRNARTGNIRVCIIERDGPGYERWVNKKDLAEVKFYMVKSAKHSGDSTWMGEFKHAKEKAGKQFNLLGVSGDEIWLVTQAAASHLPATAQNVTNKAWLRNTKKSYLRHVLKDRHLLNIREKLTDYLGYKCLGLRYDSDFEHQITWSSTRNREDRQSTQARVDKIQKRYSKVYAKLSTQAKIKYPLLKHLGMEIYNIPEFIEYRELMDKRGENK